MLAQEFPWEGQSTGGRARFFIFPNSVHLTQLPIGRVRFASTRLEIVMPHSRVVAVAGSSHIYRDLGHPDPDAMQLAATLAGERRSAFGNDLVESARAALDVSQGAREAADVVLRTVVGA
jgi:hypothetical protein